MVIAMVYLCIQMIKSS